MGSLEKVTQIKATQIKAPAGRVFKKYVYTCFMVKMRINFGPFGLFWFNLGRGQCTRKDFGNFEFWVSSG